MKVKLVFFRAANLVLVAANVSAYFGLTAEALLLVSIAACLFVFSAN